MLDYQGLASLPEHHALELLAESASERLAREVPRAAPDFLPQSRWRDAAFWSGALGPVIGVGFIVYFASEIGRAVAH